MSTFLQKLTSFKKLYGYSREELGTKLGVSGKYIGMIERGEKVVDAESTLAMLLASLEKEMGSNKSNTLQEEPTAYIVGARKADVRWIPVISWAHAGRATAYDEMPDHWQSRVMADCRSENAFGLIIEGDSMEPRCVGGDVVIAMPTEEPCNGCLVVAKLKDDGIVLRRYAKINDEGTIRLSAYNPVYPPVDYHPSSFHWIYPIHSTVRSEWPN